MKQSLTHATKRAQSNALVVQKNIHKVQQEYENRQPPFEIAAAGVAQENEEDNGDDEDNHPIKSTNAMTTMEQQRQLHALLEATPVSILNHPYPQRQPPRKNKTIFITHHPPFGVPLVELLLHPSTCAVAQLDPQIGVPNLIEGCVRLIDAAVVMGGSHALVASKVTKTRFHELVREVRTSILIDVPI
jgi:hypothetical protein